MKSASPFISVIIPVRPGQSEILAVEGARGLKYPRDSLEILVARGRQPAVQRNVALRAARGEFVYFLDDDAFPDSKNLDRAIEHFQDPQVVVVGGPSLCPPSAPIIEQLFAVVLGSWLAFGPSRARYKPVGEVRTTDEKEIILCNMLARRLSVVEIGGFDEALYPNEENALMDTLSESGGKLIYDPHFATYRRPRPNLPSFCRMLFSYGRGRAEQVRLHPSPGSALNFVPPVFCLYVVLLFMEAVLVGLEILPMQTLWAGLPLVLYGIVLVIQTLALIPHHGIMRSVMAAPLQVASHVFYGAGFWRGLVTNLNAAERKRSTEVVLESIPV